MSPVDRVEIVLEPAMLRREWLDMRWPCAYWHLGQFGRKCTLGLLIIVYIEWASFRSLLLMWPSDIKLLLILCVCLVVVFKEGVVFHPGVGVCNLPISMLSFKEGCFGLDGRLFLMICCLLPRYFSGASVG